MSFYADICNDPLGCGERSTSANQKRIFVPGAILLQRHNSCVTPNINFPENNYAYLTNHARHGCLRKRQLQQALL